MEIYSTYEAKARFSEILRKVRAGRRVVVTHHGVRIAEIRPVEAEATSLDARLAQLEREGVIKRATRPGALPKPLARRPGGLARFLATRD